MEIGLVNTEGIINHVFNSGKCLGCKTFGMMINNDFQCKCENGLFELDTKCGCQSKFLMQKLAPNNFFFYCKRCPILY